MGIGHIVGHLPEGQTFDMVDFRPPIPADLCRKVLVEAGHRCAIPTCRYIEVEVHHIIPWAECNDHKYENLIALCPNCHQRADRGAIDRKSLRIYKANLRFAHDKFSQFEIDTLFAVSKAVLPWPAYMNLLLKRLFDANYIELIPVQAGMSIGMTIGNIKTTPDMLQITQNGRDFIASLSLEKSNE
jgi:hypothetical protein